MMYKQRDEIEQAFDAMKNELENDKPNLKGEDSIRGYFFVFFLSPYLYYKIFARIGGRSHEQDIGEGCTSEVFHSPPDSGRKVIHHVGNTCIICKAGCTAWNKYIP